MTIDWDSVRFPDGSIDLVKAWIATGAPESITLADEYTTKVEFLEDCQRYQPIVSRQAASIAIAMADNLNY